MPCIIVDQPSDPGTSTPGHKHQQAAGPAGKLGPEMLLVGTKGTMEPRAL